MRFLVIFFIFTFAMFALVEGPGVLPKERQAKPKVKPSNCKPVDTISGYDYKSYLFRCEYEKEYCYLIHSTFGVGVDCVPKS